MFELLFLLLPIAAAYGYYMGRNSYNVKRAGEKTEQTKNYLRGVDFFINNDKDQAVDQFIAYLDSGNPSFESSLALGNLFRQRGEVDRAISLHTSLANNDSAEPFESEMAQLELATDFISAGLLDRAEAILLELVEIPRQHKSSVCMLIKLYEQVRDFEKAIELGSEHKDVLGPSELNSLSHYYCELALQDIDSGRIKEATKRLNSAQEFSENAIRPLIMLCEIKIKEGGPDVSSKVIEIIEKIASKDKNSGMFCLELLSKCGLEKTDPLYKSTLESLAKKTSSAAVLAELCDVVYKTQGNEEAQKLYLSFINERPNIKLFSAYMGFRTNGQSTQGESETVMQLKSIIDARIASHHKFSCSSCGFESSMMFWQCPSCRRFDTIRPTHSLDGD